jgi:hypothetical protein
MSSVTRTLSNTRLLVSVLRNVPGAKSSPPLPIMRSGGAHSVVASSVQSREPTVETALGGGGGGGDDGSNGAGEERAQRHRRVSDSLGDGHKKEKEDALREYEIKEASEKKSDAKTEVAEECYGDDDDDDDDKKDDENDEEDVNETERNELLFKHACEFGRDAVALLMITKKEVRVGECHNDSRYLPLHVACRYGRHAVVEALLQKSADPNARTATGKTPLHFAVVSLHAGIVETLLKRGADSRVKDNVQHLYASQMATVDTPDNRRRWLTDPELRQKTFAILDMLPLLQRERIPDFMRPHFINQGGADYFELNDTVPLDEYGCPYSDDEDHEEDEG